MVSNMKEIALERLVERRLTGLNAEDLHGGTPPLDSPGPFRLRTASGFDPETALDADMLWEFLQATQSETLEKIQRRHPNDWQRRIADRLGRLIARHGLLHLLRRGIDIDDAHFALFHPAPLPHSAASVHRNFAANIFAVMRQIPFNPNSNETIDMALFVNGLPIITIEFKNPWTGQRARPHGQQQYQARDTSAPLLQFGRVLVHMAVDPDEVWMTTRLAGPATRFLPFNKGTNNGAGNPLNPNGHKTAYLWEEVLTRESLAGIIQHFVLLERKATTPLNRKTLIFPRYHQLDVVRKLLSHAAGHGVGHSYLVQHSAGSGKSNSITWAAFQLIEICPERAGLPGARATDQPLFDSVIVVTDHRLLDQQLRDNIREFAQVSNIVAPAHSSAELKSALEAGRRIIITTIQKFPVIFDSIADLGDRRFAVIIDEAHSSQSGLAHDKMNITMGSDPDEDDTQDRIIAAMQARKMRGNASYFAFTATPKNIMLEKFGTAQPDGSFAPFHIYSMKQAIEEGFILDVLANYTTYKSYYEIRKSIADNPLFDTAKAQRKLRAFVERSQQTINTKAEVMLDHFMEQVVGKRKLRGKAKGMIVTQNIEAAIRYYLAITRLLQARGNPFRVLIAFSGEKKVDGIIYGETQMNGVPEAETRNEFDKDDCRLLVVANKYLTGFDQPKLCAMYVDKKLQHVQAVQALSRLNRAMPKLNKRTEDLFVLDFFNEADEIKQAFSPFYTVTTLSGATDVNVLHDLKQALDDAGVYERAAVEQFAQGYFAGVGNDQLSPILQAAAARFNTELELSDKDKIDYKIKARQFVKIYGQMASILPFEVVDWEKLFWFLKFLIPDLQVKDPNEDTLDELLQSVDLSTYGLARSKLNQAIELDPTDGELDPQNPNPRGAHDGDGDKDPLDDIISSFNERWFQDWAATPEEQRIKFINIMQSVRDHPDYAEKCRDNPDAYNSNLAFENILNEVMLKRRREEMELYKMFRSDPAFQAAFSNGIKDMLGREVGLGR